MTITPIRKLVVKEKAHHPSVLNRPLEDVLSGSGYNPDGSDFAGFAKAGDQAATAAGLAGEATARAAADALRLGVYAVESGETGVMSTQYPVGDVRRYGALLNGVLDIAPALRLAIANSPLLGGATIKLPPGQVNIGSTVSILTRGITVEGTPFGRGGTFGTDVGGSWLNFSGTGAMFEIGADRMRTITAIVRASNVVTVTYSGTTPPFAAGNSVQIAGVPDSSFNGTFTATTVAANTVTFAQVAANGSSAGGTIDTPYDAGEYVDAAEYFALRNVRCAPTSPTTALDNASGFTYAPGTIAIRDWRNGRIRLENVEFRSWDRWFWGIESDLNHLTDVAARFCHQGAFVGPRCDQWVVDNLYTAQNDTVFQIDGAWGVRLNDWTTDSDGTATHGPVQLLGSYARGTSGVVLSNPWIENYSAAAGMVIPAFIEAGLGTTYPVRHVVLHDPGVYTHKTATTPRTTCLINADNADGLFIYRPRGRGDQTFIDIDALLTVSGTGSPTAEIELGQYSVTTPFVVTGSGSPVVRTTTAAGGQEIITDGVTPPHLVLRSSADRLTHADIAFLKTTPLGAEVRVSPQPSDATKEALFSLFRTTNTSGLRKLLLYRGDGTSNATIVLNAATGEILLASLADTDEDLSIDSGLTVAKQSTLVYRDRGVAKWSAGKNASNDWLIFDSVAGVTRVKLFGSAGEAISPGAAAQALALTNFAGATTISFFHDTGAADLAGGIKVSAASDRLTNAKTYTPTLTPASVAAASVAEQTFTVTGLTTGDKVIVNPPATANNLGIVGARVSATDTLALRFVNPTAGALTPTSGVYTVVALRI